MAVLIAVDHDNNNKVSTKSFETAYKAYDSAFNGVDSFGNRTMCVIEEEERVDTIVNVIRSNISKGLPVDYGIEKEEFF